MSTQTPDLNCICIELRNAAAMVTKLYDEKLSESGISITQLSQLNHIRELGQPTLKALADVTVSIAVRWAETCDCWKSRAWSICRRAKTPAPELFR